MNKRSAIFVTAGAIVLIGAVVLTLQGRKSTPSDPKTAAPAEQTVGAAPAEDVSRMTTEQAPVQRAESFVPPPSAATGVSRPNN